MAARASGCGGLPPSLRADAGRARAAQEEEEEPLSPAAQEWLRVYGDAAKQPLAFATREQRWRARHPKRARMPAVPARPPAQPNRQHVPGPTPRAAGAGEAAGGGRGAAERGARQGQGQGGAGVITVRDRRPPRPARPLPAAVVAQLRAASAAARAGSAPGRGRAEDGAGAGIGSFARRAAAAGLSGRTLDPRDVTPWHPMVRCPPAAAPWTRAYDLAFVVVCLFASGPHAARRTKLVVFATWSTLDLEGVLDMLPAWAWCRTCGSAAPARRPSAHGAPGGHGEAGAVWRRRVRRCQGRRHR